MGDRCIATVLITDPIWAYLFWSGGHENRVGT